MADNAVNVVFTADTTDLNAGVNGAVEAFDRLFKAAQIDKSLRAEPIAQMFRALQSSSDQAIAGLVRGTETWSRAFANVATSLEIKFLQLCSHLVIGWAETMLGMTSANATKNAAITTSDQAAASASGAANASKMIKQIGSDAAATYAGVYAFFSPVMGPLAAIPAGASAASVAAMEGLVSLDVGAWSVPQNMPAFLHTGEMVVPQTFAQGLRNGDGIGSGGSNVTININAIDTQTGTQFLRNNASVIAQTMAAQARSFNRNIPAWK